MYDQKGFKKYVKRLSKADVDGKTDIIENARMTNAEKLGDWKTYIALGSEQLKNGKVGDLVLYNWGLRITGGARTLHCGCRQLNGLMMLQHTRKKDRCHSRFILKE